MDDVAGDYLRGVEDDIFQEIIGDVTMGSWEHFVLVTPAISAGHESASAGDGCTSD